MTNQAISFHNLKAVQPGQSSAEKRRTQELAISQATSASITKAASKQTYYTIRFLVDRERIANAYRAYAYFRWVDDRLDARTAAKAESLAFLERQQRLVDGDIVRGLTVEECMALDLIASDPVQGSGLRAYIQHMMAVMTFDANRRGHLISQDELSEYSRHLATAVTEALHYYIGHDCYSPQTEARYLAVTAAHITHMLRDTYEDVAAGYFNIPREVLASNGINAWDVASEPYRMWVKSRVELARAYFAAGREYLAQVQNCRCRLAGYAYMARFESVLDAIERDGYLLRAEYRECKTVRAALKMGWTTLVRTLRETSSQGSAPEFLQA